jgi:hypothetical protein
MSSLTKEGLPSIVQLDVFTRPTKDDYTRAQERARALLHQVLPHKLWQQLEENGVIQIKGKQAIYVISPYTQTEIRDHSSGRCIAYACLRLSIPAPPHDRMVAEYLLIKNAEDVYWKTANIFSRSGNEFGIATLFLIAFDIALFVNLVREIILHW